MGLIFYKIHTEETPSGARPPFLSSIARSAPSFEKMRILSRRKALRPLGFQYKIKIRQIKGFSLQFHFSGQRKSQAGIRSSSSGGTTIRTAQPGRGFPNGPRDKIHFPSGVRVRSEFPFTSIRETNEEGGFAATSGRTGGKHSRHRPMPATGQEQAADGSVPTRCRVRTLRKGANACAFRVEFRPEGPRRPGASRRHGRLRPARPRLRAGRPSDADRRKHAGRKGAPGCPRRGGRERPDHRNAPSPGPPDAHGADSPKLWQSLRRT